MCSKSNVIHFQTLIWSFFSVSGFKALVFSELNLTTSDLHFTSPPHLRCWTQRSRPTCSTHCESACCSFPLCWWSMRRTTFTTTISRATVSSGASWPSPGRACCPKPVSTLLANTAAISSWPTLLQSLQFTRRLSCRWELVYKMKKRTNDTLQVNTLKVVQGENIQKAYVNQHFECASSARSFTACSRPTPWRLAPSCARPWPSSPQLFLHVWKTATRCWPTGRVKSLWRRDTLSHSWSTYCISLCSTSGWAVMSRKKKCTSKREEKQVRKKK